MPINNITQTISILPPAGRRGVDVQTQFVIKQEDFQDHLQGTTVTELNTLKDQLNSRIGEINSTTTTMDGYASTASAGASTATTKAGEASTSASNALSYKNQAETFKNNASTSATKASQWADNNYNVAVETGKYSAKHWSTVAQNATANKVDKVTSTDNAVVRFNGATGQVQNSGITVDDNDAISMIKLSNVAVTDGSLATNGNVFSGTYTPVLTNTDNVSSSTAYTCQYMRVGNIVTVSGQVIIQATTANLNVNLDMSLPVASTFTANRQVGGTFNLSSNNDSIKNAVIYTPAAGNTVARFRFIPTHTTSSNYFFVFTYIIL